MENTKSNENRAYQEMLQAAIGRLKGRSGVDIAVKSGAVFHQGEEVLEVKSFQDIIRIQLSDFSTDPIMEEWHHLLLLHYLDLADGTEESQLLITFGNLKDGLLRGTKFDHAAELELERILKDKAPDKVMEACKNLDAEFMESNADLCARFQIFPNYPIILKIWFADEEFPASGKLFLQSNADHYLTVEDAVTAGEILIQRLAVLIFKKGLKGSLL